MAPNDTFAPYSDSELVIALVAPVGTDLDHFGCAVEAVLKQFGYGVNPVRFSELAVEVTQRSGPEGQLGYFERVRLLQDLGNDARRRYGGDVLGLAAAARINDLRPQESGKRGPYGRKVHLLRSLKHPDEVQTLRRIYGAGFHLLGVVASKRGREEYLERRMGCTPDQVRDLFEHDEHEEDEFGQQTALTFHLSDAFVPLSDEKALRRFFDLVFGCPTTTPTSDEYAMFMAFAAALRSGDLSRQVGAVIATEEGDIVAVGANDVPRAQGGLYWPGPNEHRDHAHGFESNQEHRKRIVDEILTLTKPDDVPADKWREEGWKKLRTARVMDITEYGRAVHAEMEALLSCARSAVSPRGGTLFTTTFPCHNCAKHVVAAGITRVVYVQPYPKSHALELHGDEIHLGPSAGDTNQVIFEAFQGVGPRRFLDLFSLELSTGYPVRRKDRDGKVRPWQPSSAEVRVAMLPTSYIVREEAAAAKMVALGGQGGPSERIEEA